MIHFKTYGDLRTELAQEHNLTNLQADVVVLVSDGLSNAEVADRLGFGLSERAVRSLLTIIFNRLNLISRDHLIAWVLAYNHDRLEMIREQEKLDVA